MMTDADHNDAPVALVTGGAIRVGRGIAVALADAGYDVLIHYRKSEADVEKTRAEIESSGRRCATIQGDLLDDDTPVRLIYGAKQAFGRLDILVNNASLFEPDPADAFTSEHWRRMMQINAIAPAALIESATPLLEASNTGQVINLCDISADRPWPTHRAYCASKAALANLTVSYARRLAPSIRVNGVAPGIAIFPDDYDEPTRQRLVAKVPLRREGTVEDIAQAVRFLAERGDYITGQILRVDGGRSIV
ncbi:MAG: pteridine reductase [Phycisphaerae bacterium]|nr:MAG: pteridine reductase [Phycisphaerae bacterium]